jgi:glycine hydroxymethyltransferase
MLKNTDKEIFNLIVSEQNRQENELELIASENYASLDVLEAA